jgi:hypothetical protein
MTQTEYQNKMKELKEEMKRASRRYILSASGATLGVIAFINGAKANDSLETMVGMAIGFTCLPLSIKYLWNMLDIDNNAGISEYLHEMRKRTNEF